VVLCGRQYSVARIVDFNHLFGPEWHGRTDGNFRQFDPGRRIGFDPLSIMCEAEECTEPFELLACRARPDLPRCSEFAERVQIEFVHECQAVHLSIRFHLAFKSSWLVGANLLGLRLAVNK
jgi:hypothetical protein